MERRQDREEEGAGEEGERQVHAVLPLASACLTRKKMKSRKFADFGAASQKRRSCQGCQDGCRSSRSDEQRRELLQMKELWKMCTLLRTTDRLTLWRTTHLAAAHGGEEAGVGGEWSSSPDVPVGKLPLTCVLRARSPQVHQQTTRATRAQPGASFPLATCQLSSSGPPYL